MERRRACSHVTDIDVLSLALERRGLVSVEQGDSWAGE